MKIKNTIAAIATSSKDGSISVIRVSGDRACSIVSNIFVDKNLNYILLSQCDSHTVHYGYICDEKKKIVDEVLVLLMLGPKSYTAEDVVEIQCHGGYVISQIILELLIKNGASLAEPGEFTKRAFLNGRIDLSQAEAVMDMIQAKSKVALENSVNQLKGNIKEKILSLRKIILEDIAFLEAALDDPEHLSLEHFSSKLENHVISLKKEIKHLIRNSENGRVIKEGIRTAIVGKPNVGKSSFLNYILQENRAIVTDIPGTTRDTLEEEMRVGNIIFHFIDTAGIRKTEDAIEKIGIDKAVNAIQEADFVIDILDVSRELEEEDFYILDLVKDCPGVILCNKSDLAPLADQSQIPFYKNKKQIIFSTVTGEGNKELEKIIMEMFMDNKINYNDDIYITNARQKECLIDTLESLNQLLETIHMGMPEDLYSIDLVDAYESLGKIIGETLEDDIIDKIFHDFCLGK